MIGLDKVGSILGMLAGVFLIEGLDVPTLEGVLATIADNAENSEGT